MPSCEQARHGDDKGNKKRGEKINMAEIVDE
jgi:hypothetical protein